MKVTVFPSKCLGEVTPPSSKSEGHRAIICAALANGRSIIKNVTFSEDIMATIDIMTYHGATFIKEGNTLIVVGRQKVNLNDQRLYCNESGSTLRFLIPLFSLSNLCVTFTGKEKLFSRPLDIYEKVFKEQKLFFHKGRDFLTIEGALKPDKYIIDGSISSQFTTGLLFALPLLDGDSQIEIQDEFESKSYIDITLDIMSKFNIFIERKENIFYIKGNQVYKPFDITIGGDYSQAAFFAVLGAINNDLTIKGLNHNSLQGDKVILDILKIFKINITYKNDSYIIKKGNLNGQIIDLKDCPDLGPITMIMALFNDTCVKFINIKRLRMKESDRLEAMKENILKLGGKLDIQENEMTIFPSTLKATDKILNPHNDHRILMSLAVLATTLKQPITIDNALCVNKSYPDFFNDLIKLGIKVELYE